jgi:hypothetical protein
LRVARTTRCPGRPAKAGRQEAARVVRELNPSSALCFSLCSHLFGSLCETPPAFPLDNFPIKGILSR